MALLVMILRCFRRAMTGPGKLTRMRPLLRMARECQASGKWQEAETLLRYFEQEAGWTVGDCCIQGLLERVE